jgi:histidinol-phosphate aminotransferase
VTVKPSGAGLLRKSIENIKPYEPGRPIELVERELGIKEAIKLASNESPYPPFERVIAEIRDKLPYLNRYPDGGATFLREEIAEKMSVSASRVMIGNGSNELIRFLANVLLDPDDEIVMASPSFVVYPLVAMLMQAKAVQVPVDDGLRHDLDAMLDAITERTKLLFICNPNNPTGTIVTKAEVERFLEEVPANVVVVFDEAYFEYATGDDYPDGMNYINDQKPVVVLRTFSKVHGLAGLRVGYGVGPEWLADAVNKVREPFNVNSVAQIAAMESLKCENEVAERVRLNSEGLKYLYGELDRLNLKYVKSDANFVLIDIGVDSRTAMNELMKKGIIVRPADIFGNPTHIRLTVGTKEENSRLVVELETLLKNV